VLSRSLSLDVVGMVDSDINIVDVTNRILSQFLSYLFTLRRVHFKEITYLCLHLSYVVMTYDHLQRFTDSSVTPNVVVLSFPFIFERFLQTYK